MLRKRLPNQEFSPRLAPTMTTAAEPLRFNEVNEILIEAGVTSSHKLGKIHRGSWHDTILAIENLADRKCTSAESATIRVTIDALCSGRDRRDFVPYSNEDITQASEDGRVDEPRSGQRGPKGKDNAFFDYKKYTIADHEDARAAVVRVTELFANQSRFIREARMVGTPESDISRVLDAAIRASIRSPKTIPM